MITVKEAIEKLSKPLGVPVSQVTKDVMTEVLQGNVIKQRDTFLDVNSREYIGFLENRMSQEHLGYLAKDQANGIWGGSTVEGLKLLASVYGLNNDGMTLNSEIVRALLDGQRSPEVKNSEPNSYAWYQKKVQGIGGVWETAPFQFNLVGIRGYVLPKGKVQNVPDIYNDLIAVCWKDAAGKEHVEHFVASCDPGLYYYAINPVNPKGCAHLEPGQYKYVKGIHRTYPALVQYGNVTVKRSNSGNPPRNAPKETGAHFGINIHAGSAGNTVYNASAGCQVIQSNGPQGWQWKRFTNLVFQDVNKHYYYTLFDEV